MTERTITAGAFDLATGNLWTCGAIAIPNPTNGVAGQVGVIRVTAAPPALATSGIFLVNCLYSTYCISSNRSVLCYRE